MLALCGAGTPRTLGSHRLRRSASGIPDHRHAALAHPTTTSLLSTTEAVDGKDVAPRRTGTVGVQRSSTEPETSALVHPPGTITRMPTTRLRPIAEVIREAQFDVLIDASAVYRETYPGIAVAFADFAKAEGYLTDVCDLPLLLGAGEIGGAIFTLLRALAVYGVTGDEQIRTGIESTLATLAPRVADGARISFAIVKKNR